MTRQARIGGVVLDGRPRAVAVVDRVLPAARCAALRREGADLVEVRADLFREPLDRVAGFVLRLRRGSGLPLICTVRETRANRAVRLRLFERLLPLSDAVDIEVDTGIREEVIALAGGRTVIVSHHDFRAMPSDRHLRRIVDRAVAAGADIVKVAGMARSAGDAARLLAFCAASACPMVAIAMGPLGAVSRVVAPLFGSLFSYAFLRRAVAPGQLSLDQLTADYRRFYPGRRRRTSRTS